jgi:hypothetical protein
VTAVDSLILGSWQLPLWPNGQNHSQPAGLSQAPSFHSNSNIYSVDAPDQIAGLHTVSCSTATATVYCFLYLTVDAFLLNKVYLCFASSSSLWFILGLFEYLCRLRCKCVLNGLEAWLSPSFVHMLLYCSNAITLTELMRIFVWYCIQTCNVNSENMWQRILYMDSLTRPLIFGFLISYKQKSVLLFAMVPDSRICSWVSWFIFNWRKININQYYKSDPLSAGVATRYVNTWKTRRQWMTTTVHTWIAVFLKHLANMSFLALFRA